MKISLARQHLHNTELSLHVNTVGLSSPVAGLKTKEEIGDVFFLAVLHALQDLSSLTRDRTQV